MIKAYKKYAVLPKDKDKTGTEVSALPARQRKKPFGPCFNLSVKYSYVDQGNKLREMDYKEHNPGFDCNYKREWKTLAGVERFIEKKYGAIVNKEND